MAMTKPNATSGTPQRAFPTARRCAPSLGPWSLTPGSWQARSLPHLLSPFPVVVLGAVVGRFLRDRNVMGVVLPHGGGRDLNEPRVRTQLLNGFGSAISHSGSETSDKLIDEVGKRPFERHASLDSLRNQLAGSPVLVAGLSVSFARSLHHRTEAAHSAIGFERAALVEDGFARAFGQAGKQSADHHAVCAGGDRLGHVSR